MDSSSKIYKCNCFVTRQAARFITKIYESHLAPSGLTSTQFTLLALLSERDGATMREISEMLVLERTSVIRSLQPLERDGLISIGANPEDVRINVIRLTSKGKEKMAEASPLWRNAQQEFEKTFGKEFADQMRLSMLSIAEG